MTRNKRERIRELVGLPGSNEEFMDGELTAIGVELGIPGDVTMEQIRVELGSDEYYDSFTNDELEQIIDKLESPTEFSLYYRRSYTSREVVEETDFPGDEQEAKQISELVETIWTYDGGEVELQKVIAGDGTTFTPE